MKQLLGGHIIIGLFEPIIVAIKHVDVSMIYHDRVVFDSYCLQCNGGHEQCSYNMMVTS